MNPNRPARQQEARIAALEARVAELEILVHRLLGLAANSYHSRNHQADVAMMEVCFEKVVEHANRLGVGPGDRPSAVDDDVAEGDRDRRRSERLR